MDKNGRYGYILIMTEKTRIEKFEKYFDRRLKNGTQIFWMKYNPESDYRFDLEDAREDIEWMVAEIKRLQLENGQLKEFIDTLRIQMEDDLGTSGRT